jgi:hypothetical protein
MSKFCPAGKMNCEGFAERNSDEGPFCLIGQMSLDIYQIEVCGWPSRQQPIAELTATEQVAAEIATMPGDEFHANCERLELMFKSINKKPSDISDYDRGRSDMKAELLETVKACHWYDQQLYDDCIKAIEALK